MLGSLLSNLFRSRYAWLTNTVTGAALFIIGDGIEQKLEVNSGAIKQFDKDRMSKSLSRHASLTVLSVLRFLDIFFTLLQSNRVTR